MLTPHERIMMSELELRLKQAQEFISSKELPSLEDSVAWYSYLAGLKIIQGNTSNDVSFVATLLAKQYLIHRFGKVAFDAAEKPQGAPGFDIDLRLPDGRRLVAEIKSTHPYKANDLGAQQLAMFKKDFYKLAEVHADIKLFFLTEPVTFELMKKPKYRIQLAGVTVVLLPTGTEFTA